MNDIEVLEELRKELALYADGEKIKQGQALENLLEYLKNIAKQLDNIEIYQIPIGISELQFFSVRYKDLLKERQSDKERIKELEEYANWHIEHISEDIADYIDDDRIGNKNIIGEFKEERENWRDINRILNNEKTYIDYKTY